MVLDFQALSKVGKVQGRTKNSCSKADKMNYLDNKVLFFMQPKSIKFFYSEFNL